LVNYFQSFYTKNLLFLKSALLQKINPRNSKKQLNKIFFLFNTSKIQNYYIQMDKTMFV